MGKPTFRRFGLGLLQQLAAMGILLSAAGVMFHSILTVESMHGTKTYKIDPFHTEPVFENSEVYQDIFRTAVSDITRLVVIKGELETDGEFDPKKEVDVTRFAGRTGTGNDCAVTAVYTLDDLIKWGKSGVEYTNRVMSMTDFLNYFGPVDVPENYGLDEYGQLYFAGFYSGGENEVGETSRAEADKGYVSAPKELQAVQAAFDTYTKEQLQDMAFSYIMAEDSEGTIGVSREDDGSLSVYFPLLICRYETVEGERQLISYADNWPDYMKLQANLAETILTLSEDYQQYVNCNDLYREGNTNLNYMVRMTTEEGKQTFTNVSMMEEAPDSAVTDFFAEYRRYLIYYPDSLEFTGNTVLSEGEIHQYIKEYEYAYPESTHIWIGAESGYPVAGDAFYNARTAFERIVPNIGYIVAVMAFLGLCWIGIWIYLTFTAGIGYDEDGNRVEYILLMDKIWIEVWALLGAAVWYGAGWGWERLLLVAGEVSGYSGPRENMQMVYEYGVFGLYGIGVSLSVCLLWYSLVRRIRYGNVWKDSFLYWIFTGCRRFVKFVFRHRNSAVSTLLPYNLFLFVNIAGTFGVYILREDKLRAGLVILGVALFDVIVGMLLFKHNGEQIEIVEGINRIRNGEVDFKLDTEMLHGANKEMADAVNNIGEGIRKAVKTSMKDEQMKTDLITNVSHDIKTPLTSIINYVDLLKRLHIEEEPAKGYIAILESKSQRLKQLTDDLLEASKISSGNIVLNRELLNLTELLNQSIGEFSEKFQEKGLEVIFSGSELRANIYADSRRMWRVVENLFHNICKYAMESTRVYLDLTVEKGKIHLSVKNISKSRMNIRTEELTERFIRGDLSRSEEGSGLGLSIAKSLIQLQGGDFEIYLDGDLFKVMISFPEYEAPKEDKQKSAGAGEPQAEAGRVSQPTEEEGQAK